MHELSPLMRFLRNPAIVNGFDSESMSLLFAESRQAGILPRVAHCLSELQVANKLSERFCRSIRSAINHSTGFGLDVRREIQFIAKALSHIEAPVLLLKGASYVAMGLPAARGRIFSDIDLLVSAEHIRLVESELMLGGWRVGSLDPYDERYYRQWSHEIPPMTHLHRGTTIDLHHSLVMPTCRMKVDSAKMIQAAVPIDGSERWWRLKDEDMVLHSAAHLLLNGEFDRGLRDLWDIDILYRHFSEASQDFSARLMARAKEVGLETMLQQTLYLVHLFFATPVSPQYIESKPDLFVKLIGRAVSTRHPDTRLAGQSFVDWLLMVREVSLRLPPNLLLVHLLHKMYANFWQAKSIQP